MEAKTIKKKKILYGVSDKMPFWAFVLTAIQHMLLNISVGLAVPVAVSAAAGLNVLESSSFLAASLFGMGIVSILQSIPGKYIGCGNLSMSVSDSVAIGCCIMAVEAGGMHLVFGLSLCACLFKFIFGHFTYKLRKIFPTEATGTMVFILGLSLVPTAFKYFLGTAAGFNLTAFIIACATLLVMIICTFFIPVLKPYCTLIGIAVGYILSMVTGLFDFSKLSELKNTTFVQLPIYTDLGFSFKWELVIPFIVVALASVVDNIGDFSACQFAANPDMEKTDWKRVEGGIRASGLGNAISVMMGGALQSTATANIGVSRATGIVSRRCAYLASALLMVISFFPGVTGILSMIPAPVLGAVIMYSTCYIFSSGFATLQKIELDDKKIISIFLSFAAAVSTLIPNLYSFLPENVQNILISPMVLGIVVLIITTIIGKIGTKKKYEFSTGVSADLVKELDEEVENVCKKWGTPRILTRKLQIAIDGICESLYEINPESTLNFGVSYDEMQIKIKMDAESEEVSGESLDITLGMLRHMFDNVNVNNEKGRILIRMDEDI